MAQLEIRDAENTRTIVELGPEPLLLGLDAHGRAAWGPGRVARMLAECFRVLRPAGRLRLATPDLRVYIDLFGRDKSDLQRRYIEYHVNKFLPGTGERNECFVLNNEMRNWGHEFVYDEETLRRALGAAGFTDIVRFATGESDDPELRGVEFHGKVVGDEEMNAFETMVLEARKPATNAARETE